LSRLDKEMPEQMDPQADLEASTEPAMLEARLVRLAEDRILGVWNHEAQARFDQCRDAPRGLRDTDQGQALHRVNEDEIRAVIEKAPAGQVAGPE
jgi:hypothetical protein